MKSIKILTYCVFFSCVISLHAQIGIGTTTPQSILDIEASNATNPANNDGLLIPRMNNFPANPGTSRNGMLIFYTGSGASGRGFYYWDQPTTSWTPVTNNNDADWYTSSTSTAPSAITDNIYTEGNVTVNSGSISVFTVDDTSNGLNINKTINLNNPSVTLRNANIQSTLNGTSNLDNIRSDIFGNGTGTRTGFRANLNTTGTGTIIGFLNNLANNNATLKYGLNNYFNSDSSTGSQEIGVFNNFTVGSHNGTIRGIYSWINAGTGTIYGSQVRVDNGSGLQIGLDVALNNGSSTRYGVRSIVNGANGTPYGIYSSVQNSTNGYSGYFIGRASFGNTTTNRYLLPAADGNANEVMATNGAGIVNFVDISSIFTDTDDQTIDTFSFDTTTNVLTLEIEDDGIAAQNLDLSTLVDHDWYQASTTNQATNISNNLYTNGDIGIGGNPSSNLHVYHGGNAGNDGFRIENTGANNRYWRMYVYNSSGDLGLFSTINGNTLVGSFNDASGVYSATSDRRLKKDFKPLPFSWEKLMALETMSYLYKIQKDDKRNLGLIAQDVNTIYPELVTYNKINDVYHLNYSGISVIAIKATQELKKEVNILKEENASLKAQLNKLRDVQLHLDKLQSLESRLQALEGSLDRQ